MLRPAHLRHLFGGGLLACFLAVWAIPASATAPLDSSLIAAAPAADPQVIRLALKAVACAEREGRQAARQLAVIDYSRPSTQRRLWVFDLARHKLLFEEWVAHGRNSGSNYARRFSNEIDSFASSLGLFLTRGTYQGRHGYSLRMAGLEPGINDRAQERALVMHSADYVSPQFLKTAGRLGRSQGCPAVRAEIARPLIDAIKDGQYLFAYYPDRKWLDSSRYFSCAAGGDRPR